MEPKHRQRLRSVSRRPSARGLLPGLIFEIATAAGITMRGAGDKRVCKCPFHEDGSASAFVSVSNVFFCSVCTPSTGWTAKRFAEALGVPWFPHRDYAPTPLRVRPPALVKSEPTFSAADAAAVWAIAVARARDEEQVDRDRDVDTYLSSRGLLAAWETGAFGILPRRDLPAVIDWWPGAGYRLVAPLFEVTSGVVVSVQARAVVPRDIKVQTPKGARMAGTAFADWRGQRVLAGEPASRVVLGEGLTDMLALAIASPWPVLTAPGTSTAVHAVGSWAMGAEVLLALDDDHAGELAVEPVRKALVDCGARAVRRVYWPARAKDACEVIERRGAAGLREFLRQLAGSEAA